MYEISGKSRVMMLMTQAITRGAAPQALSLFPTTLDDEAAVDEIDWHEVEARLEALLDGLPAASPAGDQHPHRVREHD